jgi:S-methylmethionine-dependent homocysteine/selenocysteine methylase
MAVELARAAADEADHPVWVAGSAPPLEDCYRPDLVPEDDACEAEHREHVLNLAWAGADGIAVETMNCVREAVIASRAARATGLPFWVSFVCGDDARLLSGETLGEAIAAVRPTGPAAVGVNCAPAVTLEACLPVLARCGLPWCIYANLGAPLPDGGFRTHDCSPNDFAEQVRKQRRAGARMIGGCCGTTPEHLRAAAEAIAGS